MSRIFGGTGRRVATVGQGSWRSDEDTKAGAIAALRRGLDLGMTHIDTAELYGSGAAESLVGAAIKGRRDEVFLVSKVMPANASKQGTIAACEKSLGRLGTDRLDCYLLHWRGRHPLTDTVAAFESLRQDGKIRSWGVSNFDVADLEELMRIAAPAVPVCNQVLYHLEERYIEHALIPWCASRRIAVVAYTPFGERPGLFAAQSPEGRVLREIAAVHHASSRQVALAFLLRHPEVFVIPKASTLAHVADNAAAAALELSAAEIAQIDSAFARGSARRGLPTL